MADEPTTTGHPNPTAKSPGYHETKWAGMPMYQCDTCHFNSMNKSIIEDHVENALENNRRLGRSD